MHFRSLHHVAPTNDQATGVGSATNRGCTVSGSAFEVAGSVAISRSAAARPGRRFRKLLFFFLMFLPFLANQVVADFTAGNKPTLHFEIPRQRADEALTALGQQADITVLYRYDFVKEYDTNQLHGEYTVSNAVAILLENTGLSSEFDPAGHLIITVGNRGRNEVKSKIGLLPMAIVLWSSFAGAAESVASGVNQGIESSNELRIEEIIVTAQKREQSVQDVPISLAVITAIDMQRYSINQMSDLEGMVPNFSFDPGYGTAAITRFTIRGISSQTRNAGFESGASVYVDGVYAGRGQSANQQLTHIERVEILRGPQGTLFGKNTVAGAINIITKKPGEEFEADVGIDIGNYNLVRLNGFASFPVVEDKVFMSLSAYKNDRNGYMLNLYSGERPWDEDSFGGNMKLRILASQDLELNFKFHYFEEDHLSSFPEADEKSALAAEFAPGVHIDNTDVLPVEERQDYGLSLTADYTFGNDYTFTSITAYAKSDLTHTEDNDLSPLDVLHVPDWRDTPEHATQEFRLVSPDINDKFNYVLGAYLFWQNMEQFHPATFGIDMGGPDLVGTINPFATVKTKSYAVYGQGNYFLTDKITLTAGVRYTVENKDVNYGQSTTEGFWEDVFPPFSDYIAAKDGQGTFPNGCSHICGE